MASPTGIIPDDLFHASKVSAVLSFLEALPIPGDDKVNLLAGWQHWTGLVVDSASVEKLRESGSDRLATRGH
jgi:hypothetical protein